MLIEQSPVPVRFVAMDFAGHGYSTHKPLSAYYSANAHAVDAFAVADALKWEQFYLIGHSLGM
jgi:pimeloyl-ACP methyl ester carboxylesterase